MRGPLHTFSRRVVVCFGASALALVACLIWIAPAGASRATGYVGVDTFDATLVITPDGQLDVTETITARFSGYDGHGIYRELTTEVAYPPQPDYKRVYKISDVRVTADPGLSTSTQSSQIGDTLRIRIGDADRTIGPGLHTYTLRYTVLNALNHFDDHDELYWNVTGNGWNAIRQTTIRQRGPAPFTDAVCFAGPTGSNRKCTSAQIEPDGSALFTNGQLYGGGVTTAVAFPVGAISPTPTPALVDMRFSLSRSLGLNPVTLISAIIEVLVLCGAVIGFVLLRGRDRQMAGSAIDQAYADANAGDGEPVPLFGGREIPVEFVPPDNLRPGLLGVLVDEDTSTLDVTSTIVDLATRGYIRIVEVEPTGTVFKHADWRLDRMRTDVDGLMSYEVTLINALFTGENRSVVLSDLQNTFAKDMTIIKGALTTEVMNRRWFRRDPNKAGSNARWIGGLMVAIGTTGAFFSSRYGIPPIVLLPFLPAGLLLFFTAGLLPARTPQGTAVYRHALGFRRFITESEKHRAQFAERANIFTEYLPYAVVFGATKQWAQTFEGLGLPAPDTSSWYYSSHPFMFTAFASSLNSFAVSSAGTLTSTPGGSGSSGFGGGGFSGGGGGGGGGGGW